MPRMELTVFDSSTVRKSFEPGEVQRRSPGAVEALGFFVQEPPVAPEQAGDLDGHGAVEHGQEAGDALAARSRPRT